MTEQICLYRYRWDVQYATFGYQWTLVRSQGLLINQIRVVTSSVKVKRMLSCKPMLKTASSRTNNRSSSLRPPLSFFSQLTGGQLLSLYGSLTTMSGWSFMFDNPKGPYRCCLLFTPFHTTTVYTYIAYCHACLYPKVLPPVPGKGIYHLPVFSR